jgi:hypothetical protein
LRGRKPDCRSLSRRRLETVVQRWLEERPARKSARSSKDRAVLRGFGQGRRVRMKDKMRNEHDERA